MTEPKTVNLSLIRAPVAVILAWLVPGLGHVYLGYRARGIIFLVTITLTFGTGVAIGGVKTVSPERITYKANQKDHEISSKSWWFFGQIMNGTYAIICSTIAERLPAFSSEGLPRYLAWPSGDIGSVYSGVAGLLNLLVIIDALARVETVPVRARQVAGTARKTGPPVRRG